MEPEVLTRLRFYTLRFGEVRPAVCLRGDIPPRIMARLAKKCGGSPQAEKNPAPEFSSAGL